VLKEVLPSAARWYVTKPSRFATKVQDDVIAQSLPAGCVLGTNEMRVFQLPSY
jgi:hypothetical protein